MEPWGKDGCDCEDRAKAFLATLQRCGFYPNRCAHDFEALRGLIKIGERVVGFVRCKHCGRSERRAAGAA